MTEDEKVSPFRSPFGVVREFGGDTTRDLRRRLKHLRNEC